MKVSDVLAQYVPGDADKDGVYGWADEFAMLWTTYTEEMVDLLGSVRWYGFLEPIVLGEGGRIWDGHHRLAVAVALLVEDIPTVRSEDL